MATDDWFRNESWNPNVEEVFFGRLAKSRSQRDQYLVIQALTLASAEPAVALRLVDLYFESKRRPFEDVRALMARAKAYQSMGSLQDAIEALKQALEVERQKPNHKTTAYVDYPYLVATNRLASEYPDAKSILFERVRDVMFPLDKFKWNASLAIIEHESNNPDQARKHARAALEAAGTTKSGFRFHRRLGLVGNNHPPTIAILEKIGT
jgi:tetratricopeptide (TPR) repeat protein